VAGDLYATGATGEKMADHGAALGGGELSAQEALQERGVRMVSWRVGRTPKGMPFEIRGGVFRRAGLHELASRVASAAGFIPEPGTERCALNLTSTDFEDPR
jgi:hypothetical protein